MTSQPQPVYAAGRFPASSPYRAPSEPLSSASTAMEQDFMRQYSHCTSEPGCVTDEECELAAELTADFASMCGVEHREHAQQQEGQAPQPLGAQDAAYPNRGASLASTASMCSCGAAGGGEAPPLSLYEQLGGGVAVKQVVDGFYDRVLAAAEVKRFFQGVDMSKLRRKFLLFATYALGGPDEYLQLHPEPWPQLYAAHKRLIDSSGLRESHFDAIKRLFGATLADVGAPAHLIEQALSVVESTRRVIFPLDSTDARA